MAAKLKITYLDDEVVEVIATPRAQVQTERFLKGYTEATMVEAGYRLGFESLAARRLLRRPDIGYEEWLDSIADVEELESEPTDPTPEGQSPTPSSD